MYKVVCVVLIFAFVFFSGQLAKGQEDSRGLNYSIDTEGDAVDVGTLGFLIMDFANAKLDKNVYRELDESLADRDKLKELVERSKNGNDVLGVAIFLNQRFPEKKFVPISNWVSVADLTTIPIDLFADGKKLTTAISSETFGEILYEY